MTLEDLEYAYKEAAAVAKAARGAVYRLRWNEPSTRKRINEAKRAEKAARVAAEALWDRLIAERKRVWEANNRSLL